MASAAILSLANPLRRSRASKHSRCGTVRMRLVLGDSRCSDVQIYLELREPSAEIVRVEALSLLRRECVLVAASLLRRSCVAKCRGTVRMCHALGLGEPSAQILCVETCCGVVRFSCSLCLRHGPRKLSRCLRACFPQSRGRAGKSQLLRPEVRSRSSGYKVVRLKRESSTRRALP